MSPGKANPASAVEPSSPGLHLLPGDEQFQARSTTSISLLLASASREGKTIMCFIIMGTKLQSQDQPDGSRNAHFRPCRPHGAVPCAPMPVAHKPCLTAMSYWTKKPQKQPQRNCLYPNRSPLPFISSKRASLQHLSPAPSIQDGEGIVRCGTSINISKRNRWHEKRWTQDLFRLETKKLQGSFILDGLAFWFISIPIPIPNLYS